MAAITLPITVGLITRSAQAEVQNTGYASVADFELRTGQDVPADQEQMVQTWLNSASSLVRLYLGDCAEPVETAYPDILTDVVVTRVNRLSSQPYGVTQMSVGSSSSSYGKGTAESEWLAPSTTDLLDKLMDQACGTPETSRGGSGVGQVGAMWGGPPEDDEETLWIVAGSPNYG
jgi:hypothetical protein